jgi:hypothetical protein
LLNKGAIRVTNVPRDALDGFHISAEWNSIISKGNSLWKTTYETCFQWTFHSVATAHRHKVTVRRDHIIAPFRPLGNSTPTRDAVPTSAALWQREAHRFSRLRNIPYRTQIQRTDSPFHTD